MRDFEARLELTLRTFLGERGADAVAIDARLGPLVRELGSAVSAGGKRLRPLLAAWGYRAGGEDLDEPMVRAGAALELLHTFALIQDDVMDRSETRRGRAASYRNLAGHAEVEPERFGPSAAILLGDLALIWADQLLLASGFPPERLTRGLVVYNQLRTEVTLGQYLDVLAAFGDPEVTGKPSGEDLRERKPTWLRARTLHLRPEAEGVTDVERLRGLMEECG